MMLVAIAVALAVPAVASAIGISLDRSPAPPAAVQRGVGVQTVNFTISYQTIPANWLLRFSDPSLNTVQSENAVIPPNAQSPIIAARTFAPSGSAPLGRYRASVDFFSAGNNLESSALVVFDVADQLGAIQVVKFEDVNGNAVRDAGEPGVPGWSFRLTNPQNNGSVVSTGVDGTVTVGNVPAGIWTVEEIVDPLWAAITPVSGQVTVPAGGVGTFIAGNVRPAPISGVVYLDTNRNGIRDAGEVGRSNVRLDLTGTRPGGITVAARDTRTAADGSYSFPGLLPGSYAVAVAVPGGLTLTTARTISGIGITSGVGSPNHNFGLASGDGSVAGGPTPNVTIQKTGPETARAGSTFRYSITVRNRSAFTATNVQVTDLVPATLTLVAIPAGATIRNGVVTWSLDDMKAGASRTLTMDVRVNPNVTGTIRNTATVTADGLPPRNSTAVTRVVGPVPVARAGGVTG
jgi:uncharacterized repeat protein (TIGR01451 family)